jgi:hypothetical protein
MTSREASYEMYKEEYRWMDGVVLDASYTSPAGVIQTGVAVREIAGSESHSQDSETGFEVVSKDFAVWKSTMGSAAPAFGGKLTVSGVSWIIGSPIQPRRFDTQWLVTCTQSRK